MFVVAGECVNQNYYFTGCCLTRHSGRTKFFSTEFSAVELNFSRRTSAQVRATKWGWTRRFECLGQ